MVESLNDLVVDEAELDQRLLTSILAPFARIAKPSGRPAFTPEFSALAEGDKILVYLLARKAAVRLGLLSDDEGASPKEIAIETGVKYGTVKPSVISLANKSLVASKDGKYSVPNYAVFQIEGRLARK